MVGQCIYSWNDDVGYLEDVERHITVDRVDVLLEILVAVLKDERQLAVAVQHVQKSSSVVVVTSSTTNRHKREPART